jgi:hypothetical protein
MRLEFIMKTKRTLLFLMLACLGGVQQSGAQGTAFAYQGQLQRGGSPANGLYDFTFELFANSATNSGQIGGIVTNLAVGVTNGLFTSTVDFGAEVFTGASYWLAIGVRTNGGTNFTALSPLQELAPTPYAMFAPNAGAAASAASVAGSNIVGNIGCANLPASVLTNGESGVNLSGAFSGDGWGLTNLSGVNLAAGSVGSAQLAGGTLAAAATLTGATNDAVANTSYVVANASPTTVCLPANANIGDMVQIIGQGAGGWTAVESGIIWKQTTAPGKDWTSVASSSDGTHLVAASYVNYIYTSTNSGTNWTQTTAPVETWYSVASSSDGTHLVAGVYGGGVYTSTNSGANWAQTTAPSENWQSVTSSSDGTHLVAGVYGGGIYTSTNSGANWAQTTALSEDWYSVASSSDGTHLVAVVYGGGIYTSTNSGANWAQATAPAAGWISVASSSDGTHLVAIMNVDAIYISTNSGANWAQAAAPSEDWQSVASSSDGTHLVAVAFEGGIYTSTNSGANWTQAAAPSEEWESVASSSDGTHLVAVVDGGGIYTYSAIVAVSSGTQGSMASMEYVGNGQWQAVTSPNVAVLNVNQTFTGQNNFMGNNVGIGNTSPAYPLDVNGDIGLEGTHLIYNAQAACIDVGAGGSFYFRVDSTTGNIGTFTTPMKLTAAGSLTITGTLSQGSDRNAKEDFAPVNAQAVLAKVASLPIEQWQYKAQEGVQHLGPMAQDFHAAFGLNGGDDKHIATVDEEGVALAAIQGLNQKLEAKAEAMEAEMKAKDAEIEALKQSVAELQKRLK